MKKLKIETLSKETFHEFGSFADMLHPEGIQSGKAPAIFWPDKVVANFHLEDRVAFGVSNVNPRPMVIERMEIHEHTCEIIMPLDQDVALFVAPPMRIVNVDENCAKAFLVPKGTMVCLRPGVLHCAPFTLGEEAHTLIVLPELNYRTDLILEPLEGENRLELVL